MELEKIGDLVYDSTIYPRHDINRKHVNELKDSFRADEPLPPLVVCKVTKKIIDGIHRWHALIDLYDENARWYIKWESFSTDSARFLRSVQLNARHGMRLEKYDRAHCLVIAEKLNISVSDLAAGFGCTKAAFDGSVKERFSKAVGVSSLGGVAIPLKRTIRHMAGKELTQQQVEANDKLQGWPAHFYAEQLIALIDAELMPRDEKTMEALKKLYQSLSTIME